MKVRILTAVALAGAMLPCDAAPDLSSAAAAELVALGAADPHPDAVAYAETLGVPVPELPPEVLASADPPPPPAKKGG